MAKAGDPGRQRDDFAQQTAPEADQHGQGDDDDDEVISPVHGVCYPALNREWLALLRLASAD
jgi:hypothetical protein